MDPRFSISNHPFGEREGSCFMIIYLCQNTPTPAGLTLVYFIFQCSLCAHIHICVIPVIVLGSGDTSERNLCSYGNCIQVCAFVLRWGERQGWKINKQMTDKVYLVGSILCAIAHLMGPKLSHRTAKAPQQWAVPHPGQILFPAQSPCCLRTWPIPSVQAQQLPGYLWLRFANYNEYLLPCWNEWCKNR